MAKQRNWKAVARRDHWQVSTVNGAPQIVCKIDTGLIDQEAVAHLIAAAPALLASLRDALWMCEGAAHRLKEGANIDDVRADLLTNVAQYHAALARAESPTS